MTAAVVFGLITLALVVLVLLDNRRIERNAERHRAEQRRILREIARHTTIEEDR